MAGSKIPVPEFKDGDQVPPGSGVPPRLKNRSTGVSILQSSTLPSVPASTSLIIETDICALSSRQGPDPETV